jgi:hypothetical protein
VSPAATTTWIPAAVASLTILFNASENGDASDRLWK